MSKLDSKLGPMREVNVVSNLHTKNTEDGEGVPVVQATFIDFATEVADGSSHIDALGSLANSNSMKRPRIFLEFSKLNDLELIRKEDADKESPEFIGNGEDERVCMLLTSAHNVVDLTKMQNGRGAVTVNAAFPPYYWFHAMNVLLANGIQTHARALPFPTFQEDETVVFSVLPVTAPVYNRYLDVLEHAVSVDGMEKGFMNAGKFSYVILEEIGVNLEDTETLQKKLVPIQIMKESIITDSTIVVGMDPLEDKEDSNELANRFHIW